MILNLLKKTKSIMLATLNLLITPKIVTLMMLSIFSGVWYFSLETTPTWKQTTLLKAGTTS